MIRSLIQVNYIWSQYVGTRRWKGRGEDDLKRTVVDSVRRICCTLQSTTTNAVKRTISQLTNIAESDPAIRIRRKSQPLKNGKEKWWYVIHVEENVLKTLYLAWENVQLHTAWVLERCTKPLEETTLVETSGSLGNKLLLLTQIQIQPQLQR